MVTRPNNGKVLIWPSLAVAPAIVKLPKPAPEKVSFASMKQDAEKEQAAKDNKAAGKQEPVRKREEGGRKRKKKAGDGE